MKQNNKAKLTCEKGQSLVEFALLIGLMIITMLVFINLSLGVFYHIQIMRLNHDIARILSTSAFEESSETTRKINELIALYQASGPFTLDLFNEERFQYTVAEIEYSKQLHFITVRSSYLGTSFPALGRIRVSAELNYPKIIPLELP